MGVNTGIGRYTAVSTAVLRSDTGEWCFPQGYTIEITWDCDDIAHRWLDCGVSILLRYFYDLTSMYLRFLLKLATVI